MSRRLDDLDPRFKPLAMELLARCVEAKIPVMVLDTLRTEAEHQDNLKRGVSWTRRSKHLPQPPAGKSWAIDIAPYQQFLLHGPDKLQWDAKDPAWKKIGRIGEKLGLRWGGRWKGKQADWGHFEYTRRLARAWEKATGIAKDDVLDGAEFYALMNAYRTGPLHDPAGFARAFEDVKTFLREGTFPLR